MKSVYRLFRRGKVYYTHDSRNGRQESLRTLDRTEAQRLLAAKIESANQPEFTLAIGKAYLGVTDSNLLNRTWAEAMDILMKRGCESTQSRCKRALENKAFDPLRAKRILETTSGDFLAVMADGKHSTNHYLRLLHSLAQELGWLVGRSVSGRKSWPKVTRKTRRAITLEEHMQIITTERNQERRLFYEVLWETGASQTDAAWFDSGNLDRLTGCLIYERKKTGQQATIMMGPRLLSIIQQLPESGPFFPALRTWSSTRRAAEFSRRCRLLELKGVSLHSYRYAWAERAYQAGYPERFAQAALGHQSSAIHHAYARRAKVICPTLEDYQGKIVQIPTTGTLRTASI